MKPTTTPRLLSLCSGIGGIDLAAVLAGFEIAGQVEIDPFCRAVLFKNFGDLPRKADIREVQGDEFGTIDIVGGGIPCQPFSSAGKRTGTADHRYLWPEMFRIVQAAQPTWVLIENVDDFAAMALDSVSADLEAAGYAVQAFILPACATNAPHIRERIFVVAYSGGHRCGNRQDQQECERGSVGLADAGLHGTQISLAHAGISGWTERHTSAITGKQGYASRRNLAPGSVRLVESSTSRRERFNLFAGGQNRTQSLTEQSSSRATGTGMGGMLDGFSTWLDRYQWPAGPGEAQHPWEPPRTTPGKQLDRGRRLRALGNAVVWQQVWPIFAAIMQCYIEAERQVPA